MSDDLNISQAEAGIEAFGLLIAHYYDTLVRSGMPVETAATLTLAYQQQQLQQAAGRLAWASFGAWLRNQQKKG